MSGSMLPVKIFAAGAGAAGLALGLEHVWPRISASQPPSFSYLPATAGERGLTMVLCHGIQSGAEQWEPLLDESDNDLRRQANVLLAVNGCDPRSTPAAIFDELRKLGILQQ